MSKCLRALGCLSARARQGGREGRTHTHAIARDQHPVKRPATRTGARVRPDVCPSDGVTRYRSRYNGRSSAKKVKLDKGFLMVWCFSHTKTYHYIIMNMMKS